MSCTPQGWQRKCKATNKMAPMYNSKGEQVSGFVRPAIKHRECPKMAFMTYGNVSEWVVDESIPLIPSGTPGLVGMLVDKTRNPTVYHPNPKMAPSIHYELISKHMNPEAGAAYRADAEEWFAKQSNLTRKEQDPVPVLDHSPLLELYSKYKNKRPPIGELVVAMRLAGYPESKVEKSIKWNEKMEEREEEMQKELDLFFGKWPCASKTAPKARKVVKKAIKAVKKKM